MHTPINLAEIRQQNLLARGILTPQDLQRKKAAGEAISRTNANNFADIRRFSSMRHNKAAARDALHKKWLQQRSNSRIVTNIAEFSAKRDSDNDRFLLEASKEIPGVMSWSSRIGREILKLTNDYRATKGLSALQWNQPIHDVSLLHSHEMATKRKGFDHRGFSNRVDSLPFKARSSAENLFMSTVEHNFAQDAVNGWIRSPGHQKNLVGSFTLCGIGVEKDPSSGKIFATQIFTA
ncbi:putative Alkaline phosphatase [Blattamonas nauphoetae]|uniref:Alkaline phosphatase n=1 Tax=Blattamonas nauphoetae TaxID=2049346 RepID=A0ABQ9Y6C1_9EUKA|nr:putative Alkaline phosphatase [Blattamonas nauphoetae]